MNITTNKLNLLFKDLPTPSCFIWQDIYCIKIPSIIIYQNNRTSKFNTIVLMNGTHVFLDDNIIIEKYYTNINLT